MAENAGHMDAALRLSAIVESSDDAIVSKDLNGIATSWNRAAERMFGYTAVEMIGRSILVIIPDDRIGEEAYVLDCVRRRIGVDHYETERRHKDGHRVSVSLTVSPILSPDGRLLGASKIARDISERKQLVAELEHNFKALGNALLFAASFDKATEIKGAAASPNPSFRFARSG